MGEAFSEDKFKGRSILVGLEMNAKGKELLEWTLSAVAEQGDRVVAVHIFHYSGTKNQYEHKFTATKRDFCCPISVLLFQTSRTLPFLSSKC